MKVFSDIFYCKWDQIWEQELLFVTDNCCLDLDGCEGGDDDPGGGCGGEDGDEGCGENSDKIE